MNLFATVKMFILSLHIWLQFQKNETTLN